MTAVESGDLDAVVNLLDAGKSLESKYQDGKTPLMYSCIHGHIEIVKILLNRGANIEATNEV